MGAHAGDPPDDGPDGPADPGGVVGWLRSGFAFGPAGDERLGLAEAIVLAIGLLVVLVAWASLGLAQLGAHSLGGVAAVVLVALGALTALAWRAGLRPKVRVDRTGIVLVAGVAALAAFLSFPGFPYNVGDKDPGVYVLHGQAIAREGSVQVDDPVLEAELPHRVVTPGARFPGIWIDPDEPTTITPQFFHLYPALLATADDLAGTAGLFNVNPALAVLSAAAVALAVRRAFGTTAGAIAGVLLATSMLQVWQAKYPTTEMLAQALFALALLSAALALRTRWGPLAGLAGLAASVTFLARPDGVILVLLAAGGGAAVVALRGWDARVGWLAAGLALPLPHALLQAYDWNEPYSRANDLPSAGLVLAALGALVVGATVWRLLVDRRARALVHRAADRLGGGDREAGVRRLQQVVGGGVALATFALLAFAALRPRLLGQDLFAYNDRTIRSYDEINLKRLGWFVTFPGLVVMWLGTVVVGLRRWRAVAWLVVVPGISLLPIYLWSARNSPRLMWWGRRFVPSVLVGIVVLVAVALAFAFAYRDRWWPAVRVAGALVLAGLVGTYLSQSLPLRDHREMAGSYSLVESIAAQAEAAGAEQGIFLWAKTDGPSDAGRDLGGALWFSQDQISALLPGEDADQTVDAYQEAFPGLPVFVVTSNDEPLPPELADRAVDVQRTTALLPFWEESVTERPDEPGTPFGFDLTVYRIDPEG